MTALQRSARHLLRLELIAQSLGHFPRRTAAARAPPASGRATCPPTELARSADRVQLGSDAGAWTAPPNTMAGLEERQPLIAAAAGAAGPEAAGTQRAGSSGGSRGSGGGTDSDSADSAAAASAAAPPVGTPALAQCRICLQEEDDPSTLEQPCGCRGTMQVCVCAVGLGLDEAPPPASLPTSAGLPCSCRCSAVCTPRLHPEMGGRKARHNLRAVWHKVSMPAAAEGPSAATSAAPSRGAAAGEWMGWGEVDGQAGQACL